MKQIKSTLFALFLVAALAGCKKDKEKEAAPDTTTKQSDQTASVEVDAAINDVNGMINDKIGGGSNQKVAAYNLPCGVIKVDSTDNGNGTKTYKMTYGKSSPCGYTYKSGQISFALKTGTAFKEAGAVYAVTFTDYVVEARANGATVKLNGVLYTTNVNGGYIWQTIVGGQTIKHKIRGKLTITYANNEVRTREYYQLRTWTASSGDWSTLSLTIAGDSTGSTGIAEKGKTYEGNYDYTTTYTTDFKWSNCGTTYAGPYVLKQGQARMNAYSAPVLAYIDVEAGYKWDLANLNATPVKPTDLCDANTYKITTVIGPNTTTQYQLY